MVSLNQIVDVFVSRETTVPSRPGFGTPLFVGENGAFTARVHTYTAIEDVLDDFAASDEEYKMALAAFSQQPRPRQIKIGRRDGTEGWDDAIAEITLEDSDWYGVAITSFVEADILEVAAYIEGTSKIFIARSADAGVRTPGSTVDVASQLKTLAYSRTALFFHTQAADFYPDAAWLGRMLPTDPGAATWKFKTLAGIPADTLSPAQSAAVLDKSANTYELVGGVNITSEGTVASGEYIDVMHGIDWLTSEIQSRVFGHLANEDKVPYTNRGIASIEALVREKLDIAVDRGVLAPEPPYDVTVPDVLDTDPQDRAQRILRDVNFTARLAGAIHRVIIRGVVTV